jgi:DNA modification methylase
MYFQPSRVMDPMAGGGTLADVCAELGIQVVSFDLRSGKDAKDPKNFMDIGDFDFVWLHPPYWNMIHYSDDPRCLSNARTLDDFLEGLRAVIQNCLSVLRPRGKLAILIGDGKHEGEYLGLPFRTLNLAAEEGLWLSCPEIIRFSHGATSSAREYNFSFIPRLHDVCLVLKRRRPQG